MTHTEIQRTIDRCRCIVSMQKNSIRGEELHYGNLKIEQGKLYYEHSVMLDGGSYFGSDSYRISALSWREATPEEIEKYVKP